ncbi:Uncharacterised protein r2_g220 [Pycnogonum litorale]
MRTVLSLIKPCYEDRITEKQQKQKEYYDKGCLKERHFNVGDIVRVRNYNSYQTKKWLIGKVLQKFGNYNYLVKIKDYTRCVHVNHLLLVTDNVDVDDKVEVDNIVPEYTFDEPMNGNENVEPNHQESKPNISGEHAEPEPPQPLWRSTRVRKPVDRLTYKY